jgi:pSer/pThr/pTyr-binding forkhead associated (FHA) protein
LPLRFTIRTNAASAELAAGEAPATRSQELEVLLAPVGLVFGRAPDADVCLPYAKVSARHTRLFPDEGGYRIEDLGSTNGTRLAGRKLVPRVPEAIAFGEVFEVGGIQVCLASESLGAEAISPAHGTQTLARRLVHDLFEVGPPAESARIIVLSGPDEGREILLSASGRIFRMGRGESCDLILSDNDVSREHAAVERGPAGFAIRDLGSKNGVEVMGEELIGERPLRDGDIIRLGETRLRFIDPEDRYLRQMEVAEGDEPAVPPVGIPPPSKLPVLATVVAVTALLLALGLVLALAFAAYL